MRKQFLAWVVLITLLFGVLAFKISGAGANDTLPWISSTLSIQKQAEAGAIPSSLNGNIDCIYESTFNCAVPTAYGAATQNSTARLNGTADYKPVYSYVENRQRFIPVPNSNTVITYTTEPAYGFYLYFNYNFSSSIKLISDFFGQHYSIIRSPDAALADKTNHRLAADYASISFSENGQWMVVSDPNVAMLRVNLQTFEVLPFAPGFNYTIGIDPSVKTAISNDGRYAVVASAGFSSWSIYDLTSCAATPTTINGPIACQSRDLNAYAKTQITGLSFINSQRFINDNSLAAYITYKVNGANKTARYIISTDTAINQTEYLTLGDSYISGEGAFDYKGGTDTSLNKCHVSYLAYSYLIGRDLNYDSYHSVACSGAVTGDIDDITIPLSHWNDAQAKGKNDSGFDDEIYVNFLPGYRAQINFVKRYQPKIITLSAGGNDMGFSGILLKCVEPKLNNTCYDTYEERLEIVNQIKNTVFPNLVRTYNHIMSASPPDTRIYAIGYPQIAKPGRDCAINVRLNSDEVLFSQQLVSYLNSVVKTAAAKTGVYYVDTQDALDGHRLCEAGPGSVAMNGLTAGNDRPTKLGGPIADESYHPNALGYELLENKILSATHNLTAPLPAPNLNVALPSTDDSGILGAPRSGKALKTTEFDPGISAEFAYQQVPIDISINGAAHSLTPGSTIQAEVHSDPVSLGSFKVDTDGNLSVHVIVPTSVPAGYHSLHFYGTDLVGQQIDIYKDIYVAATADDLDGNGVMDSVQKCIGVPESGQDFDRDGVDDACDGNITEPPAAVNQPFVQTDSVISDNISFTSDDVVTNTSLSVAGDPPRSTVADTNLISPQNFKVRPAVLAASTTDQNFPHSGDSKKSNMYFVAAGLFASILSMLAYVLRSLLV
ncbi:SGNH/GDSL hydrolase family protein [Candidatus Saccharibacteria bacterium]|nr:SGNH/GDSL hydrolase family protein [Candidatus Saccharibacteria bacterium]